MQKAGAAADRWAVLATDFHGGRVGNLLQIWKAAGRFDQALRVLDKAEQMYPESKQTWDEHRLYVFNAAGRDLDTLRLAERLSIDQNLTPQQRDSFSEIFRVAKERLRTILSPKGTDPLDADGGMP